MNVRPVLYGVAATLASFLSTSAMAVDDAAAPTLLIVNQGSRDMNFVDPAGKRASRTLMEPESKMAAHEIAALPDGRTAFLPIYGDTAVGHPGNDGRTMLVIDVPSGKVTDTIDFGHGVRPHCVLYSKATGLLYVTTELDRSITIVDPATRKIVGEVPTGQPESHMLALTRDARRGYTANVGAGTVSVLDVANRRLLKVIPISHETQRISISRDDREVFTSDQTKPQLAVIDTAKDEVTRWIPLPSIGYGSAPTHDGKYLVLALPLADQVAVINLATYAVDHVIPACKHPQEVLVAPDDASAYVSCFGGHEVAAIDLKTWRMTRMIDAGTKPDGLAWAVSPH